MADYYKGQISLPSRIITDNGKILNVKSFIDAGGQGEVYRASLENYPHSVALKLFFKSQSTADTRRRIKFLSESGLYLLNKNICAPFDTVEYNGLIGHIAPFAKDKTLLEVLEEGNLNYHEVFEVASQIVDQLNTLLKRGITHGDIQSQNFKVYRSNKDIQVSMIDLDNYSSKGVPKPNMLGMTLYMAPELRSQIISGIRSYPTECSDRYSLGVLLHEVLLHFHPIAGFDESMDDIDAYMNSKWMYDPTLPNSPVNPHGYPVTTLNPELISLMRRSLSASHRNRPSFEEWNQALKMAYQNLKICSECGVPFVKYNSRNECPFGHCIQQHGLRLENHQQISLTGLVTVLGRSQLGGSNAISRRHLIIREIRSKLYVETIGMNPTCILERNNWKPLIRNHLTRLKPNDKLKIADTLLVYSSEAT